MDSPRGPVRTFRFFHQKVSSRMSITYRQFYPRSTQKVYHWGPRLKSLLTTSLLQFNGRAAEVLVGGS